MQALITSLFPPAHISSTAPPHLRYAAYVAVATSLAAAVTSWNAHDDLSKRIARYTSASRGIERLIWWWKSLDDIERASSANISLLIESGEGLITAERLAWLTALRKEEAEKGGGESRASEGGLLQQREGIGALRN